ncbi:hypothetical protein P7D95_05750 [Enterococcus avium]|uniref:hypothetical protein n=1 Tax=Enterococcus avium TaxID=33945 RepID=UPI00288E386F|nr:hypothetical protein [Enterococcus avium]MDT2480928.1 hypothetical protein [Enterococcus avium]MDT2500299.1 hypothetical protein [Enterococcus avium]
MEYTNISFENQLDFTHPYLTIKQMEKMILRNYEEPRDHYGYGKTAEEMIADLHVQLEVAGLNSLKKSDLRMPILVFPIPTDDMWNPVKYGFIVKLEANGETQVYRPI